MGMIGGLLIQKTNQKYRYLQTCIMMHNVYGLCTIHFTVSLVIASYDHTRIRTNRKLVLRYRDVQHLS